MLHFPARKIKLPMNSLLHFSVSKTFPPGSRNETHVLREANRTPKRPPRQGGHPYFVFNSPLFESRRYVLYDSPFLYFFSPSSRKTRKKRNVAAAQSRIRCVTRKAKATLDLLLIRLPSQGRATREQTQRKPTRPRMRRP